MHVLVRAEEDKLVDEAFAIAWNFIKRSGQVVDDYYAQVFLSREIMRLIGQGERHKIRIANLAIAAFERDPAGLRRSA
jgi:hypothetical protein